MAVIQSFSAARGPFLARVGLAAILCLMSLPGPAQAQLGSSGTLATPPPPPPPTQTSPRWMAQNDPHNFLHLTLAQQKKFYAIQQKYGLKIMALQGDKALTLTQKQAKFIALQKAAQAESMGMLTTPQRTWLNQVDKLQGELNKSITPAQKKRQAALETQMNAKFLNIQNDKSLSAAQQKTKIDALGKEFHDQSLSILTPAQRGILKQYQALAKSGPPAH